MQNNLRLYLIRHGEAHRDIDGEPLSEKGHAQAKLVCEKLQKLDVSKVYCSTMQRAKQTASYMKDYEIEYSSDIEEIYRVIIGGNPKEGSRPNRAEEDKARADKFWGFIIKQEGNIAVFCHGNLIRYYITKVLDCPTKDIFYKVVVDNASVTAIKTYNGHLQLSYLNNHSHIPKELKENPL